MVAFFVCDVVLVVAGVCNATHAWCIEGKGKTTTHRLYPNKTRVVVAFSFRRFPVGESTSKISPKNHHHHPAEQQHQQTHRAFIRNGSTDNRLDRLFLVDPIEHEQQINCAYHSHRLYRPNAFNVEIYEHNELHIRGLSIMLWLMSQQKNNRLDDKYGVGTE